MNQVEKENWIADHLMTPWGKRKLAAAMLGQPVPRTRRWEVWATPVYIKGKRILTRVRDRVNSAVIRVLTGIDNRG